MSQAAIAEISRSLSQRDPKGFDKFIENGATGYFTLCVRLCLEDEELAQDLFIAVLREAFIFKHAQLVDLDIWFYTHLNRVWSKFSLQKQALKAQISQIKFDWTRSLDWQWLEALRVLEPFEREVALHRFTHRLSLSQISLITGKDAEELGQVFGSALRKIRHK